MKNELSVNPNEFGIEEKQAGEMLGNLPQIKIERLVLETQFDEIIKMDIESIETSKKARELRLLIQKNRTQGLNIWHKTTKDYFLKGGQFVDAIKRVETAINERMENALEEIEKHQEIKEQKRLDELEQKRLSKLELYKDFVPFCVSVRNVSDEDFEKILTGAKMQYDAKIEADKKAEQERIEAERLEKERLEQQRLENERLKKEAEEKEKALEKERQESEAERKRIEAEANAKLEAERKEREKIEAELKAKIEAEKLAEQKRIAEIERQRKEAEKLAKAPIKKQLQTLVDSFNLSNAPIENEVSQEIIEKFNAFKTWSIKQIENL